ncbi:unnamed protein product [Cylindrotheca closterium]|uniref:Inositol polyphosphate-related phosphatase domain-containing protein n=1 Tax=Cylindrotheca closterium TaxID=2856 RepID=A0AAD2JGB1_9STRA|nr:unnamed protein product [Cylindrotheca closterium]
MNVTRYFNKKRICNSNDKNVNSSSIMNDEDPLCRESEFPYLEVRIHQGDWESSVMTAWIYQIVLMELVGVPATVGLTGDSTHLANFYSMENEFVYSTTSYSPEGLKMSNRVIAGCNETEEACVHVLPVVWSGQKDVLNELFEQDEISLPSPNGMLGATGLFLPISTARDYPQLTSFLGYQGESNRRLLAQLFKRPTTWKQYCDEISSIKCSSPDGVAFRYPPSDEEGKKYFLQGQFMGHFETTRESDCSRTLDCTGYIVGPPCDFTNHLDSQLFWNNIVGLKRDGPLEENGGYNMTSMAEIWLAAAATQSPVLMWWFSLNEIQQMFDETPWSFQPVLLPKPTADCSERRTTIDQRCDLDVSIRRGDVLGSCDDEVQALKKVFAVSLSRFNADMEEADRSPAHEFLQNINIDSLEMGDILRQWVIKDNDRFGNDAREAVCEWVVENLDTLENYIPAGFPREVIVRVYNSWYTSFAQAISISTAVMSALGIVLVSKYSKTKVMVFAQPTFLFLVLIGFLFVCIAAYLMLLRPTTFLCMAVEWLVVLGYTVTLVPVLVKTAAINRLMNSSKKMQRVRLNSNRLFVRVALTVFVVGICMIIWTINDPPIAEFRQEVSFDDPRLVIRELECESQSMVWVAIQLAWECLLLLMASVLTFQSRKAASVINDSRSLGVMIYSHVVFAAIRGGVVFLDQTNALNGNVIVALFSFNYSFDALIALLVYIYPKIYMARLEPEEYLTGFNRTASTALLGSVHSARMSNSSSQKPLSKRLSLTRLASAAKRPTKQDLKILVCTGNLGNAEPTVESMMSWIPPDGACNQVTPLPGVRSLFAGHFDLIVIGMQESTWKGDHSEAAKEQKVQKEQTQEQKEISEEEILRAMEAHDTAALRQKVRDVLGEAYFQCAEEARGQMRLHVWAAEWVIDDIKDIKITGANTGVGNVLANKGGIVLTLSYMKTKISFITAHLAAHEGEQYYKTRCRNVRSIFKEGKTSTLSSKLDVSLSSDHTFVIGDLNFRTKFTPEGEHEENVERALKLINNKDYATLYSYDELCKGIESGDLLVDFKTLPCNFPPTFKVEREGGFVYKKQRTPSYTDRILYKSMPSIKKNMRPLAYEPCPGFITSDHKPIRGAFSISPNGSFGALVLENELTLTFKSFSCMDLPPADSNGLADPYVMIMWENDLLEELSGNLRSRLRKVLFRSTRWPRTSYQSRNLNPEWKEEEISLRTKRGQIPLGSKLFLVMVDFDALSKDDYMCTVCLDLTELLTLDPNQKEKTVPVYRQLQRHGRHTGRIKVQVHVKRETMARRQQLFASRSGYFETSQMLSQMLTDENVPSNLSSASFASSDGGP